MKTLTIITTTYNRAYCIGQVYESLKRQDCKDFCWLIVDDGSTDNTREVINGFIRENLINIEYIYQENKGMTGARNTAYEACKTEINTIIDSDDWLADGAVTRIINFWNKNKRDDLAGIIALDINPDGEVIGDPFPEDVKECKVIDVRLKYHLSGDKKLVYRSDLSKRYAYPEFSGEKFFPASYKFYLLDKDYNMLVMNDGICVVDYNDDSMSFDKIAQYKSCPNGFALYRNLCMILCNKPGYVLKNVVFYISDSLFANKKSIIGTSNRPFLTFFLYPFGFLLIPVLITIYSGNLCKVRRTE